MIALDSNRRSLRSFVQPLIVRRELIYQLAARDLKVRYKQSVIGVAWAVIQPFMQMIIFSVVFSLFARVKTPGIPYPVFSYVGLVPWLFFSASLSNGVSSLGSNAALLTKIYFPREIFLISSLASALVDMAIATVIYAGMLLYYHIQITGQIFWYPLILVLQILLTLCPMLFLAAANVFYRDVRMVLAFALQLGMYVTPIVYPLSLVPEKYRIFFQLNPLTGIIDSYRRVVIQGLAPDWGLLAYAAGITLVLLPLCYSYFKRMEMRFADVI